MAGNNVTTLTLCNSGDILDLVEKLRDLLKSGAVDVRYRTSAKIEKCFAVPNNYIFMDTEGAVVRRPMIEMHFRRKLFFLFRSLLTKILSVPIHRESNIKARTTWVV